MVTTKRYLRYVLQRSLQKILKSTPTSLTSRDLSNILIKKFLAHPNLKLFITHGGMLSSTEALYRGVPIIGIPFYGDQHANTEVFVSKGFGEKILFQDITEEALSDKIKQVLGDPR